MIFAGSSAVTSFSLLLYSVISKAGAMIKSANKANTVANHIINPKAKILSSELSILLAAPVEKIIVVINRAGPVFLKVFCAATYTLLYCC